MSADLTLALTIMLIGMVGAVAPLVPGPPIVWLGALYYAWRTGFQEVGIITLIVLGLLAVIGGTSDWWLSYLGARRAGASGWATLASIVGGIVGLVMFSVPGLIVGSLVGVLLIEYLRHRDWRRVLRAGSGFVMGWLLSTVVEVVTCLVMIGIFLVALRI